MNRSFFSIINSKESEDLHRFHSHVGYINILLGIPPGMLSSPLFSFFVLYGVQAFISINQIIYIILFIILTLFFGYGLVTNYQHVGLRRYEKSEAFMHIGITTIEFDDLEIYFQNSQLSKKYELSECKRLYRSYYQTYLVLVFSDKQFLYIKADDENKTKIESLLEAILVDGKKNVIEQTALSNFLSPYLEREKNDKKHASHKGSL